MEAETVVGPTEDTVQALLGFFVEPYLSLSNTKSKTEVPSVSQQQLISKQVHAVVLLYNYYHRKRHPSLEFLDFESFCKLAVVLKPKLMAYMKLMHQSKYSEVDDLENNLSLTEKAIMDACDISLALDASKQVPLSDHWPISKVAILLIDSKKENCLLSLGTVTAGAWSVIEKDLDTSDKNSERILGEKQTYKRMRSAKKTLNDDQNADDIRLQRLALSTTEEVSGVNQADLIILESHAVYSLSKEKAAARFYIVQCAQPSKEDFRIPIKEVLESLQGSLMKKKSSGWVVTPTVEYFHMLPYVGILLDWLSREVLPVGLQDLKVGSGNERHKSSPILVDSTELVDEKGVSSKNCVTANFDSGKTSSQIKVTLQKNETKECKVGCISDMVHEPRGVDVDERPMLQPKNEGNDQSFNSMAIAHDQQPNMATPNYHKHVGLNEMPAEAEMVDSVSKSHIPGLGDDKSDSEKQNSISLTVPGPTPSENNELIPQSLKSQCEKTLEAALVSKEDALSQTALRVLIRKRKKLFHQLRDIEDEITSCDRTIQTMLQGSENDLAPNNDSTLRGGSSMSAEREKDARIGSNQSSFDPCSPQKRNGIAEGIFSLQNPCQELDDLCHRNNWRLPRYLVFPSNDGFLSSVSVKGHDFEFTIKGDIRSARREASESAATQMISNLRHLAEQTDQRCSGRESCP